MSHKKRMAYFVTALAAITFIFRDAVLMIFQSWQKEEYSHGYVIPVIALLLLLHSLNDERIVSRNSWTGATALIACIIMYFLFEMAGIKNLLPEVYLLILISAVITFWGLRALAMLAGPLGFLLFCAPMPTFFYYPLSMSMQGISTTLGTAMLELLNIPVFQDGNIIDLGGYKLQVAEACSGLRYLFPLLSLSYLFAYIYKTSFLKRAVLFLSAIPIAVALNSIRIGMIGVTVDHWGQHMAEGLLHEFEGWVVFLGCVACLAVEVALMQKLGQKGKLDFDCITLPNIDNIIAPPINGPAKASAACIAVALIISVIITSLSTSYIRNVPLTQPFAFFPVQIGPWVGHFKTLEPTALSVLGTNDYLLADYEKRDTSPVNLYTLYFPHQDSSSNEAVHTPTVCIPAGGWTVDSTANVVLVLKDGTRLTANRILISKNRVRQVVYYWYDQESASSVNVAATRLRSIWRAIAKGRTNGALVRVTTMISGQESDAAAEGRLSDFLDDALARLNGFMFPADSDVKP